ncbi:ABC transporter substrate-binding protein [Helcococcus kunzii]|uniref:ABC transporter substrate-binding protein n=1 Tax=Helcococcus kunzii TaxID=40091 RepID=UPI001C941AE9|nr:ABC transporter substrate-binding protein [Helcococcus kunzii]QZO76756.1 ABC transporter substrate-binding protein [Helcococcus kunzii]
MKKIIYSLMLVLVLMLTACGQKKENTKTDTNETKKESVKEESKIDVNVTEAKETKNEDDVKTFSDKKIVAGSKTVAEYLSLFNQKLVGIAKQKHLPEIYKDVTQVGSPRKLNLEIIISLKPDLVVANETSKKDIEKTLSAQKIETFYLDGSNYNSVFENIKLVGEKLGQKEKSETIIKDLKSKEKELIEKAAPLKGKKVAMLFGTGDNFQLMTENTYIGDLLKFIGVENIAKDSTGENNKYLPYSLENIVSANPDYILTLAHGNREQAEKIFASEFEKDLWKNLTAIKENRLIHLDDDKYPVTGNIHVMETLEGLINLLLENSN